MFSVVVLAAATMVAATKQQEQPVSPPLPKQQSPKKQGCFTKSTKLKKNQQSKATVRRARCLLQGCFAHRASLRVDRGALVGQLEHLHHVRELIMIIMLKRLSCDQTVKYGLIVQSLPDPLPGVVSNLNLVSLMCQKLPCGPRRAASRSATGALRNGNMAGLNEQKVRAREVKATRGVLSTASNLAS